LKILALTIFAAAIFSAGCVRAIRNVSDCGGIDDVELKVECGSCTIQNKLGGPLGTFEYRPDAAQGSRCVRMSP
jgi:hypothetical protein